MIMCPGDFSSHRLLLQWASTIKLHKACLFSKNGHHHKLNELQPISSWYCWRIAHFYVI